MLISMKLSFNPAKNEPLDYLVRPLSFIQGETSTFFCKFYLKNTFTNPRERNGTKATNSTITRLPKKYGIRSLKTSPISTSARSQEMKRVEPIGGVKKSKRKSTKNKNCSMNRVHSNNFNQNGVNNGKGYKKVGTSSSTIPAMIKIAIAKRVIASLPSPDASMIFEISFGTPLYISIHEKIDAQQRVIIMDEVE